MGRIDVHHHAILPEIARLMREQGAPFEIPWSLATTNAVMDEHHIDFAVVSNAVPGNFFDGPADAVPFHRRANEAIADFAREHRTRFGSMSAVPMPFVDEALNEIAYCYDELDADGILLVPHSGTSYLGDPLYDPVLEELDRRSAVVLVHPMSLPQGGTESAPYVLADFLLDTTRGAISLIMSEALDRFPNISFVLSHAGGFLPYAATRVEMLADGFFGVDPARVRDYIGRFYYDTALAGPSALPSLFGSVDRSQILFGTDWCAAPRAAVDRSSRAVEQAVRDAEPGTAEMVDRENALQLFPTVAARLTEPGYSTNRSDLESAPAS